MANSILPLLHKKYCHCHVCVHKLATSRLLHTAIKTFSTQKKSPPSILSDNKAKFRYEFGAPTQGFVPLLPVNVLEHFLVNLTLTMKRYNPVIQQPAERYQVISGSTWLTPGPCPCNGEPRLTSSQPYGICSLPCGEKHWSCLQTRTM